MVSVFLVRSVPFVSQELLLILDEYWQANPHLQHIPIHYASKLASRALRVYQTYANMMNARIRAQMDVSNPFSFRYIQNLKSIDVNTFDDSIPSVVFASPGMLQSGVSRQLFDRWATDPKNGVMIAGYAVEHTLAKEIMAQPKEVVTLEGRKQPLNCLVDYVSFSAHVDFVQNRSFITQVAPKHIILVHGQKDEMGRLKSALMLQYKHYPENKRPTITMPPNQIEVKLKFARRRSAKVMGALADREEEPREGEKVRGILVTHNFHSKLVAPEDLSTYTPLRVGSIASKLHVPFAGSLETLKLFLHEMFAGVREEAAEGEDGEAATTFILHGGEVSRVKPFQMVIEASVSAFLVRAHCHSCFPYCAGASNRREEKGCSDSRVGSKPGRRCDRRFSRRVDHARSKQCGLHSLDEQTLPAPTRRFAFLAAGQRGSEESQDRGARYGWEPSSFRRRSAKGAIPECRGCIRR